MSSEDVLYDDEESIDRERIIPNGYPILNEFFCPICFCLLWKPRSCSSCENLFCNKCIQTWLNENSNTCPLCRSLYTDKPVSSLILSHYSIRCRNSSFGCTEILSYDLLEQHENIHCKYLTKKCRKCEQIVLVNDIKQHQNKCKPIVIECPLCQYAVKIELFQRHQEECLQQHSNVYEDLILPSNFPNETTLEMNFIGIEMFNQSRKKSCRIRLYAMFQLILSNLPIIHVILLNFFGRGCGNLIRTSTIYFQSWTIYQLFIFSILFNYSLYYLLQTFSDTFIISFLIFSVIIWSSINPKIQVNQFQINFNIKEILLIFILIFLFLQIPLLIIRFYFDYISIHTGGICLTLTILFFAKTSQRSTIIRTYFF